MIEKINFTFGASNYRRATDNLGFGNSNGRVTGQPGVGKFVRLPSELSFLVPPVISEFLVMRKFFSYLTVAALALGIAAPAFAADKEKPKVDPAEAFKKMDKDSDGSLTEAEVVGKKTGEMADKVKAMFAKKDKNKDGKLSLEEFKAGGKKAK